MVTIERPSGVWNSRAPFHNYFLENANISRDLNVLTLAVSRLRFDIQHNEEPNRKARGFLKVKKAEGRVLRAWGGYHRSFRLNRDGQRPVPTVADLNDDLKSSLYGIREMAVVRTSALFESFAQCWALNYLLATLERGASLTASEDRLRKKFGGGRNPPTWYELVKAIPRIADELKSLPHVKTGPEGREISVPLSPGLNAFSTISFWRAVRNSLVHSSGIVTTRLHAKHAELFEEIREGYHVGPLERGRPIPIYEGLPSAMATTHYVAAKQLNGLLEQLSNGRRGHPEAPGSKTSEYLARVPRAKPLLMSGDHPPSVALWETIRNSSAQL